MLSVRDRARSLRRSPAVVVVAASFGIAELLTGSTRPVLLVASPAVFVVLVALYGCGVLSIRALALRWRAGWASLLALGAAFGVLEEGLVARSFFDPGWGDLGALAGDGRWAGVNWVWATYLTIFHALFSVAIPIALTRAAFPAYADAPWLSGRGCRGAAIGLGVVSAIGVAGVNPHAGSGPLLAGAAGTVLALVLAARVLARADASAPPGVPSRPSARRFGFVGFGASAALFLTVWVGPSAGLPAGVALGLLVAGALAAALVGRRMTRRGLAPREQLALIAGALCWLALVDLALVGSRPDTAALVVIVALVVLRHRRKAARGRPARGTAPSAKR